jgi:hypothetical protein
MDCGIGIAASSDSWKLAQRAEELGFSQVLRRCAAPGGASLPLR